jgi:hypothetical protein
VQSETAVCVRCTVQTETAVCVRCTVQSETAVCVRCTVQSETAVCVQCTVQSGTAVCVRCTVRTESVNFNVNFNVLLSKYIVHPLVKIEKTLIVSRCTVQLRNKTKSCYSAKGYQFIVTVSVPNFSLAIF